MSKSSLNYTNPPSGSKLATTQITEDGETKEIQRVHNVFGPLNLYAGNESLYDGTSDMFPLEQLVYSGVSVWTASGSGTNEYYFSQADVVNAPPLEVTENSAATTEGTVGSLTAGEWGWGDNDTIGFDTLYIRLSDGTDPDTKATGYVSAKMRYFCDYGAKVVVSPYFSVASQTAKVRPILWGHGADYPFFGEEVSLTALGLTYANYGAGFTFDTNGARLYSFEITQAPASGTLKLKSEVV